MTRAVLAFLAAAGICHALDFGAVSAVQIGGEEVSKIEIDGAEVWVKPSGRKTARDYVQNGLVAMWDGIENAGWDTHSASATTWKDLAGAQDLTWAGPAFSNSTWHWDDKCFDFSSADANNRVWLGGAISAPLREAINSGNATIEVVFYQPSRHNSPIFHVANNSLSDNFIAVMEDNAVKFGLHRPWNNGRSSSAAASGTTRMFSAAWHGTGKAGKVYRNGEYLSTGSTPTPNASDDAQTNAYPALGGFAVNALTGSGRNMIGKVYCIRVYNRELTAEEISANHAVDVERFGLGTASLASARPMMTPSRLTSTATTTATTADPSPDGLK